MAADEKPHVYVPPGEQPPGELVIEDIEIGEGAEATSGSTVDVHYVGVDFETGEVESTAVGAPGWTRCVDTY